MTPIPTLSEMLQKLANEQRKLNRALDQGLFMLFFLTILCAVIWWGPWETVIGWFK